MTDTIEAGGLLGERIMLRLPSGHRVALADCIEAYQQQIGEAVTIKSQVQALLRALASFVDLRDVPESVRKEIRDVQSAMRKTWADLADDAKGDKSDKAEPEPAAAETEPVTETTDRPDMARYIEEAKAYANELTRIVHDLTQTEEADSMPNIAEVDKKAEPEIVWLDEAAVAQPIAEVDLAETSIGHAIELSEQSVSWDGAGPLRLNAVLIQPGPGNKAMNRYYPAEMLRRDAHVFEGGKMYPTDHVQSDKSAATEVADILKCPTGFTTEGGPMAEIGIFDPAFARKVYNRAQLGTLRNLHLSIIGAGETRKGKIAEAEYAIVTKITSGSADFVTQAGAGGHAVALAEEQVPAPGTEPETQPETEQTEPVQTEPVAETLTREAVLQEIKGLTGVPKVVQERLAEGTYANVDELKAAAQREVDYLKRATGSGKPVAQNGDPIAERRSGAGGRTQEQHDEAIAQLYEKLGTLRGRTQ